MGKNRFLYRGIKYNIFGLIPKTSYVIQTLNIKHLIFCKHLLGTKRTSSNIGVRAELGRFPVENFINSQAILYLARLHTDNLNPLLKEAFELSKSLDSQGVSNNHEAYTNKNNT